MGSDERGRVALCAVDRGRAVTSAVVSSLGLEGDEVAVEEDCLADLRALRFSERSLASSLRCSRSSLVFAMVLILKEEERRGSRSESKSEE
jgi:hypothetical protein